MMEMMRVVWMVLGGTFGRSMRMIIVFYLRCISTQGAPEYLLGSRARARGSAESGDVLVTVMCWRPPGVRNDTRNFRKGWGFPSSPPRATLVGGALVIVGIHLSLTHEGDPHTGREADLVLTDSDGAIIKLDQYTHSK